MSRILPTLVKRGANLAAAIAQRDRLDAVPLAHSFEGALAAAGLRPLRAGTPRILQVNVGRRCNQSCRHCHVDAGPERTEMMARDVMEAVFVAAEALQVETIDITGGAPELHRDFREIVARAATLAPHVIHRCNLTAVRLPNYADIPDLLAELGVEIVASLPYFQARETDAQRGDGVFEESIATLRDLNALGYGRDPRRVLTLVTNPVGTFLPGQQAALERHWRQQLARRFGVEFTRLFTITNMPISRFLDFLEETGRTQEYMDRLVTAFNPATVQGLMCRDTVSVSWDGSLYDCDFNQMLELPPPMTAPQTIHDLVAALHAGAGRAGGLAGRTIAVGPHCFGCTAGAGSSCGGATATP